MALEDLLEQWKGLNTAQGQEKQEIEVLNLSSVYQDKVQRYLTQINGEDENGKPKLHRLAEDSKTARDQAEKLVTDLILDYIKRDFGESGEQAANLFSANKQRLKDEVAKIYRGGFDGLVEQLMNSDNLTTDRELGQVLRVVASQSSNTVRKNRDLLDEFSKRENYSELYGKANKFMSEFRYDGRAYSFDPGTSVQEMLGVMSQVQRDGSLRYDVVKSTKAYLKKKESDVIDPNTGKGFE